MKLNTIIKRTEKATGNKVEKNGTGFFIKGRNYTARWYENGEGSGSVVFIAVDPKDTGDTTPGNSRFYTSYYRTIKAAVDLLK